jgi:hypothetical protein
VSPLAGGGGALADALEAREQLAAAAAACPAGQALAPGLDYLIGCEYNAAADQLWLLAGNNSGGVGFFPVAEPRQGGSAQPPPAQQQQQQQPLFGPPAAVLAGDAHSDVVRSLLWPGAAGSLCLTGGEDSKICVWSMQPHAAAAGPQQQQQHGGGGSREPGVARKHNHHHSQQPGGLAAARRAAPY